MSDVTLETESKSPAAALDAAASGTEPTAMTVRAAAAASPFDFARLRSTEPVIPWVLLRLLADAVAAEDADGGVTSVLMEMHEAVWAKDFDCDSYEMLYVPAIFELAAPRLSEEGRSRAAVFLVEQLVNAGQIDSEIDLEVLQTTLTKIGDAGVTAALDKLDAIMAMIDDEDFAPEWFYLLGVLDVVGMSQDAALRQRVTDFCRRAIRAGIEQKCDIRDVATLAGLFAALGPPDARELLTEGLQCAAKALYYWTGEGEFLQGLKHLDQPDPENPPILVSITPTDEWLPMRVGQCRAWYERVPDAIEDDDEFGDTSLDALNGMGDMDNLPYYEPPPAMEKEQHVGGLTLQPTGRYVRQFAKVGRNEPCPCGSGKKYKKCCGK